MAKCDMKMPEDFLLKISKLGSNFDSVADTVLQAGGEVVLRCALDVLCVLSSSVNAMPLSVGGWRQ